MPPRTSDSHPCSPSWRHDPPPDTGPRTLGASMATEPTPAPAYGPALADPVITRAVVVTVKAAPDVFRHGAIAARERHIVARRPPPQVTDRSRRTKTVHGNPLRVI